ncbi:MAG: glycosyltransferase [Pirellulaceae bacterium]
MPSPIRVALIITELEVGGAERCLAQIAMGLSPAQFAVELYSLASRPVPGKDALVMELEQAGIPLHFLGCDSRWSFAAAIANLGRGLKQQRPAVLMSFLFHANVIAHRANRRLKLPHIQGLRVVEQGRARRWLQGFVGRQAAQVVCVSQGVRDFAEVTLGIDAAHLRVIPNGIELPSEPGVTTEPAGPPRLISVGRLHPQKGFDWLLESAPQIFQEYPGAVWEILGEGPQRAELESRILELGLQDNIRLLGQRNDVAQCLARADLFLLPSRWEGMPNALLEAMAAGLPVVATEVEGINELLGRDTGQTAPSEDSARFVVTLLEILADRALGAALGAENRTRVGERFSLSAMLDQYARLLAETAR